MPLFSRLASALKAFSMTWSGYGGTAYGTSYSGYHGWNNYAGTLPGTQTDYKAAAGPLDQNPAVSICLNWIADNYVEAELEVRKTDGKKEPIPSHPLVKLLDRPNPYYDGDTLWATTIRDYCVDGNAYWLKARGLRGAGRPLELWHVPYWQMRPVYPPDGSEYLKGYEYHVDGKWLPVEARDVVHFAFARDYSRGGRVGIGRLTPLAREIFTDNECATYTAALLKNMGMPSFILNPKDSEVEINASSRTDLESMWKQFTRDGRGKPLIPSVAMTADRIGFSPDEMALDKIRQVPEARICGALRIPAMVVGLSVGENQRTYANLGEARAAAYEECLMPMQSRMAATLLHQLLPDLGDAEKQVVRYDYSRVRALSEDQDAKAARAYAGYKNGVLMRSEARSALGLESGPEDEVYFVEPGGASAPEDPSLGDTLSLPLLNGKALVAAGLKDEG